MRIGLGDSRGFFLPSAALFGVHWGSKAQAVNRHDAV